MSELLESSPEASVPFLSALSETSPPAEPPVAEAGDALVESDAAPQADGFARLGLEAPLLKALEKSGYTEPTPIQRRTIPLLLEGRDVLGQAQTGTGKTAAFALPLLQRMDLSVAKPQVLVLAPTRELAIQVAESFERYASFLGKLRVAAIYGGQDYQVQFRQLDRGAHVIVGTPGRVMDHMRRGSLNLDELQCLVLDEADEMLRMGFADDVEWVLTQAPRERQMALFSATLPEPIRRMAQQHLQSPAEVTIAQRSATADTVRQRYVVAATHQKEAVLTRILEAESIDGVIIFVKTKSSTEPLAEMLTRHGHRAAALNGDVPQRQREQVLENLRSGKLDILVATDVAARGLDVQRISHVINYDLPYDSEAYVHRIGRTGRAGRSGEAILFVHPRERGKLRRMVEATRQPIDPMPIPSNRVINKKRVARFHERITASVASADLEKFTSLIDQYCRQNEVPLEQIAAALALMVHDGKPPLLTEEVAQPEFFENRSSRPSQARSDSRGGGRPMKRPGGGRGAPRMETYRIEVGHAHQVRPSNIVGAIANETGLEGSFIGRIDIFDDFSTVDLPEGMPRELFVSLKRVRVGGRKLNITRMDERPVRSAPYGRKPKR